MLGRPLVGKTAGSVLLVAVTGSAYAGLFAKDARGYSIASVALFIAFLTLLLLCEEEDASTAAVETVERRRVPRAPWLWLLYSLCAAAALWTHLLSGLVVGLLSLLWLGLALARRPRSARFLWGGLLAHGLAALAFAPWLFRLSDELGSLRASAPTWMTPATWWNGLSVFWYWYPFGPVGLPDAPPNSAFPVVGVLSLLLPLAATVGAARIRAPVGSGRYLLLATSGLGVAVGYVSLLWLLQRLGVVSVFHAPRYPALAVAVWAAGLVGLAGWAAQRWKLWNFAVWAFLCPWLVAASLGHLWASRIDRQGGFREALRTVEDAPAPGTTLYVMPSELLPFYRNSLAAYRTRRIEELPCELRGASQAWVLNLNFWRLFDRPRDLVAQHQLESGALAVVESVSFPEPRGDYRLYHLREVRQDAAAALCSSGLQSATPPIPATAVSVALAENQRYTDGWSFPEVNAARRIYRWATAPLATVRFDRPLSAGTYTVHYHGYRTDRPENPTRMTFRLGTGEADAVVFEGEVVVHFGVQIGRSRGAPTLSVSHPTWSPADAPGAADSRRLASAFLYAWIERGT